MTGDKSKKSRHDANKDYQDNFYMFALAVLLGGAGLMKYEYQIKLWFFDHILMLVFAGFALIGLLALWITRRMKKKNKDFLERALALKRLKPSARNPHDYYKRRN